MRDDVLNIIRAERDVTNAVILTHNIDFVYVQTVVLTALRRCGHPTITIFADSACAAESFAQQEPVLTGLGVRYRVVPVAMNPGFRFHPKAVLLSGEKAATLLVGSGNLTFGGWRENAEVWTRFQSESDGVVPFIEFRDYLSAILGRVALPDAVEAEIDEAFDPKNKSWMSTEPTGATALIGRVGSGAALLERMLKVGGGAPVDELVICAPYFDSGGVALKELVSQVDADDTTVLCQPGRSTLQERAWKHNAARARLRHIDSRHLGDAGIERSAFVHAKFYGFRRADGVVVLAGSANCSRAALTAQGKAGNAELMAVRMLTLDEFDSDYLGELSFVSEPIVLPDDGDNDIDEESVSPVLRILAARFEAGSLLVGYSPPRAIIAECLIDGVTASFESIEKGVVGVLCSERPTVVVIRARVGDELLESDRSWVDHEHQLQATARGRSLADTIRARVQPGAWGARGWADVLDVFCKNVKYMPVIRQQSLVRRNIGRNVVPDDAPEFAAADVFATDYRSPTLNSIRFPAGPDGGGDVQSLQQLLLRWFGVETQEPAEEEAPATDDEIEDVGEEEIVDRPEPLPVTPDPPPIAEATIQDKRRIERLVSQLEQAMTSKEFLSERGPEYLAADLKMGSVLLRIGLQRNWIKRKRFFDLTQKIWSSLFFSSAPDSDKGWLEYRADESTDRDAFVDNMRSPELSAALIGWYLAAFIDDERSPEAARLALAVVLAVARLPWVWHGGEADEIANELAVLLSQTAEPGLSREEVKRRATAQWELLLRRGHALRRLEASVQQIKPAEIRGRISTDELPPGELLWQGRAGFCVVLDHCSRNTDKYAKVLKLQGDEDEKCFCSSFTVPLRALLEETVIPLTQNFGHDPRQVLREFLEELSVGIR